MSLLLNQRRFFTVDTGRKKATFSRMDKIYAAFAEFTD
jgi:hypothetical protein